MQQQNYKNSVRYYPPHHFVFYPVIGLCVGISIYYALHNADKQLEFGLLAAVFFIIGWLSFMLRQHYALMNQDRIVRLELRLRYYQLTNKRLEEYEAKLSFKQLAAVRFASDDQFPTLLQQAVEQNMAPGTIKKAVVNWVPDDMRV